MKHTSSASSPLSEAEHFHGNYPLLFRLSILVVGITSPNLVSFASPSCRAIVLELAVQRRFVCTLLKIPFVEMRSRRR
jgi:hypothetical protein